MRRTVFAVPSGPAQPLSDDPDVHELGVAPRWRTLSVAGREAAPPGAVRVRLPRRLSGTRQEASGRLHVLDASNVLRWLRGELPFAWVGVRSAGAARAWEAVFPRRGLGRPKPLPQRQPRPCPRCAEMDGWGCEDHQRPPLTLRTLLQASYELEARGPVTRNPDGTVNVFLCPRARAELFSDPEFQRNAMGFIHDRTDGSIASVAGLRFFLRRERGWAVLPGSRPTV